MAADTTKKHFIRIRGANVNNLKNLSVDIPRDKFVVFTGLSGSGKSSLAFDTIYAEGQRRYMESLSSYARQFLGQMEKPDVESIEGLPPAISIDQKSTNRNPRSTVGTVTEIYDYFRLLYARVGIPHCPKCGREIKKQTVDQMVDSIMSFPERTKIQLLAPVVRGRKGTHAKLLEQAKRSGYVRVQIDGNLYELSEEISLDKNIKHNIEIVVDRLIVKPGIEKRLSDSIETVLDLAEGLLMVDTMDGNIHNFSQSFSCPDCGISVDEIEPRSFSFNNPFGACPDCLGLGYKMEFDIDLMIPDRSLSILDGAIVVTGWQSCTNEGSFSRAILDALAREYDFSLATPFEEYPEKIQDILINGTNGHSVKVYYKGQRGEGVYDVAFPGLIRNVEQRYRETGSDAMKQEYESFMRITPCKTCKGQRLKKESLAVTVADKNIYEVTNLSIEKLKAFLADMQLSEQQQLIGRQILKEIRARVSFLSDVGLDYLSLGRATGTLSGGEAQRIRLATQIGSGLVGVAYILDEPSIGLHQRDNDRLLGSLMKLRDLGNSLIVVEHDEDTMRAADCIVDIGPGAGEHGGQLVAMGTAEDLMKNEDSITGAYLSGKLKIPVPLERRKPTGFLTVKGAAENNLKNIDVKIPLGIMTCITGVSGSGKSSLINEILYKRLARDLNRARVIPGKHKDILGTDQLDKVINIDQSPIGRTPRSNPATYTGVFDQIRDLFAATADAKAKLSERFGLSDAQAQAIVDMRIRQLTGLAREDLENEYKELMEKIAYLKSILADENKLLTVIKEEIEIVRDKFGDDRRTKIGIDIDMDDEDLIPEEDTVIVMTNLGYIKRMTVDNFKAQNRGGKGIKGMQTINDDFMKDMFMVSTHDYILFLTNTGRIYKLKGYEIPEAGRTARGMAIVNLLQLQPGEKISAMVQMREFEDNKYLIMATKNGTIKKTPINAYTNIRKSGIQAITLREGDELIDVTISDNTHNIMLVTKNGQGIKFRETDVRETGRSAMGVRGIELKGNDEVISMQIDTEGQYILIVSANGMGKRTPFTEFKLQNRGGKGVKCYKITEKTGEVVGAKAVNDGNEIMMITNEGIVIRMFVDDISVLGRVTLGVKLMNTGNKDDIVVASITKVKESVTQADAEEAERLEAENSEETDEENSENE